MTCSSSNQARRSPTSGASRPSDGDAVEVGGRVDIVRAPGVTALDERDEIRAGAQERPGALVAGGRRDDLGPVLTSQQHRITRLAVVGGDRRARLRLGQGTQGGT